ncbi:hypothetical protein K432DRAFT_356192 [Lepidopterella palustris CBS 459.81]|uniref:Ion transport domain-containing protein n=1 Tax=Lepidopterella palustris CBS 459.81 TaxID=1314670 RepID=A0A8E2JDT5_9PEZI|nr:hypothetical protein K432DRAFT_356192 [Lepidopterella palustris CBS 459.81]
MFASLLRHQRGRGASERSPFFAAFTRARPGPENDHNASESGESAEDCGPEGARYDGEEDNEDDEDNDNDNDNQDGPLLPVFSEALDRLPTYNTTHSIRIIVVQRCETTLSWDQLRSPQVSQFLVKPIQQQIRESHFSRATLYALIANCLQFRKEGQTNPGNVGVSGTRAMICELLAMRLIKEFSTRELIDALSYDFDPLQGLLPPVAGTTTPGENRPRSSPRSTRISTVEIAIRAQAKKFLAHPLVVQQLEAIWAGTIVFHSAADNLHRQPSRQPFRRPFQQQSKQVRGYGTTTREISPGRGPSRRPQPGKREIAHHYFESTVRRSVTLYDPHNASLFKLSRLRVPRYRQMFSTCSFAIMLGLFLAVLLQRSLDITALEVLFWFWSAGFMLDEVVGFSEQGFGLYIMSVWNSFDLGILLLFVVYYVLRLYGILMPDVRKYVIANMAYDVLASTAVLLFPRLFSVLDHYRYFSQLLIAFRMMAMDLVAILLLIIIACSGFFFAFTLSFSEDLNAAGAAYVLFQMLMGFTPAAWDIWDDYNLLGKALLTLFLFICHFLIMTILITVLTNSFMAIVENANEEHQFLFAVNTISMVKSDALFSYIAPTNILGWLLIPLRFFMPFRRFVQLNRTIIKVTHMPILFSIFLYERVVLSHFAYGPTDLVEQRGRATAKVPAFSIRGPGDLYSPGARLREPSITTFQKDRALEEVFRRPFRDPTLSQANEETIAGRRKSSNVVRDWMQGMGHEGGASPPLEQPRSVLDQLETRRPRMRRVATSQRVLNRRRNLSATTRSAASDPEELTSFMPAKPYPIQEEEDFPDMSMDDLPQQTDADGDDELVTNDEDDRGTFGRSTEDIGHDSDKENKYRKPHETSSEEEYFRTPLTAKQLTPALPSSLSSAARARHHDASPSQARPTRPKRSHNRNLSTNTVLFSPTQPSQQPTSRGVSPSKRPPTTRSGTATPGGRRTPNRPTMLAMTCHPRPILPPQGVRQPTPNIADFLGLNVSDQHRRDPSFNALALDLASDIGDNRHGPNVTAFGAMPASFSTQLEMAAARRRTGNNDEDAVMVNRIMLARMTTLEEGFRDMLKEVKGLRREDGGTSKEGSKGGSMVEEGVKMRAKGKKKGKAAGRRGSGADADRMGSSL